MNIVINAKPRIFTANTMSELKNRIHADHISVFGGNGAYLRSRPYLRNNNTVRVYSIEKHNAKYRQVKFNELTKAEAKKYKKLGQPVSPNSTAYSVLVREKQYVAHVYDFNDSILNHVKFTQFRNNFVIRNKK